MAAQIAVSPASAEPAGMSAECREIYQYYAYESAPKAFAIGGEQCGWAAGGFFIEQAQQRALALCVEAEGMDCRIVESENITLNGLFGGGGGFSSDDNNYNGSGMSQDAYQFEMDRLMRQRAGTD